MFSCAARVLYAQTWKSNETLPVEDWIRKLTGFAEMLKLASLARKKLAKYVFERPETFCGLSIERKKIKKRQRRWIKDSNHNSIERKAEGRIICLFTSFFHFLSYHIKNAYNLFISCLYK